MNKPIKLGGLGMLDLYQLDSSLKLRSLGRLSNTEHPMLIKIRNRLTLEDFFFPGLNVNCDSVATKGIQLIKEDRQALLRKNGLTNRMLIWFIRNIKVKNILSEAGKTSIAFFNIRIRGKTKIGELRPEELTTLSRFVKTPILNRCMSALTVNPGNLIPDLMSYPVGDKFVPLVKLTSKEIRLARTENVPIVEYKTGLNLSINQALTWGHNVSKLTSTRHKDILLRVMHGEPYSRERLYRYNLIDSPDCPRCGELETLTHKLFFCDYVKEIWKKTFQLTNKIRLAITPNEDILGQILGTIEPNNVILTIHAEILSRIRQLSQEANYLILPKIIVRKALEKLAKSEKNNVIKTSLNSLLAES